MTHTLVLPLALVAALALGACGPGDTTEVDAAGSGDSEPWGRTFLSTEVSEKGQPKAPVAGTRITLNFMRDGHRLGAQAGCNSMGGQAALEGGRLVVSDLATTGMGCDPPRHAQDEWLARFLTSRPEWSRAGATLVLDNGTTRIVLEDREVADRDRPLRGTKWVVDTIVDGQTASSVPTGADAFVAFDDKDGFTGNAGCNGMGGTSVIDETRSTIRFSEVITTRMACEDDRMRLERAVLATLDGDARYQIEADVLRLDGPDGHGLRLRAAPTK
ncbi:MAG TPA: META domain-containing protein [Acidimicrobiales bacterium]|nr:META domain-containing protein [Acidimicrobiales bacterium]